MAKTEKTVRELVEEVENNQIRLPEMQRGYVWKSTQVRDLIDSLYRKYPAGNILMWETSNASEVPVRDFAVEQNKIEHSYYSLLLDGQQRITSLSRLLRGNSVQVRDSRREIDILFNLDHPDKIYELSPEYENDAEDGEEDIQTEDSLNFQKQTFIVATNKVKNDPKWVSVRDVFKSTGNTEFLRRAGITSLDDPMYSKYDTRLTNLRNIKEYQFNVITLDRNMSYEEVTEIFVRVNSAGTRLRGSDLALAQITAKWRGSLGLFETFRDECQKKNHSLDIGVIVRSLIVLITNQSKFNTVSSISLKDYQDFWEDTKRALSFTLDYIRNTMGIPDLSLLSSPYFIVLLAHFFHKKDYVVTLEITKEIMQWFIPANAKGRYSRGSSETFLDQDLKAATPAIWLENLKAAFGKTDIEEVDLEGKSSNSGFYKNMFIVMRAFGAKDWKTNLGISPNNLHKKDKIESHHLFPQDLLKKAGLPKEVINDIANLAFIGKVTNINISNSNPMDYLGEYGEAHLRAHCIPMDRSLWAIDRYADFLVARRKLIVDMFKGYLKKF